MSRFLIVIKPILFTVASIAFIYGLSKREVTTAVKPEARVNLSDGVALIGDSLAVGLANPLSKEFNDVGFNSASKGGTDIRAWLNGSQKIKLDYIIAKKPSVILISLGTNDTAPVSKPDYNILCERAAKLINLIRSQGITPIWLAPGPLPWMYDQLLDCISAENVRIVDQPLIKKPDDIHPSGSGYQTWATHINLAVRNG